MVKKQIKPQHLKDIDWRKREVRQKEALKDFKAWYEQIVNKPYSDRRQGQLSMISAVLWYLLPPKEYKKLVTSKHDLAATHEDIQDQIVEELSWIT